MAASKQSNANLELWDAFRAVPDAAIKPIMAGNLKGKSDINPVWRMKVLTEKFGPIGIGWNVREIERWTNECAGEVGAFVKVELKFKTADGWSEPIEGTGGSKLCGKGRGDGINDEAWKMATTDAISVACKSLGIAADIYFAKDADYGTKYETRETPQRSAPRQAPAAAPKPEAAPIGYLPLDNDTYWKCIEGYATGKKTKNGNDIRGWFITKTHAGPKEIAKFDHDVENFLIANPQVNQQQ